MVRSGINVELEIHERCIEKILTEESLKKLDIFGERNAQIYKTWNHLGFTSRGIYGQIFNPYWNQILGTPDICTLFIDPKYFLVCEVKISKGKETLRRMREELDSYSSYLAANPGFLFDFLILNKMDYESATSTRVATVGIVAKENGSFTEVCTREHFCLGDVRKKRVSPRREYRASRKLVLL